MSNKQKVIAAFRICGHAQQVGAADSIHDAELRKWLREGLTLREMDLEQWQDYHAKLMLCDCPANPPNWRTERLDMLLLQMERDVRLGITELPSRLQAADRQSHRVNDEAKEDITSVVAFWMYQLLDCKPGAFLPGVDAIKAAQQDVGGYATHELLWKDAEIPGRVELRTTRGLQIGSVVRTGASWQCVLLGSVVAFRPDEDSARKAVIDALKGRYEGGK